MRRLWSGLALLVAVPLQAQRPRIAPTASVLFRAGVERAVQDTVKVDTGIPQNEGAFLGMITGAGVGYLLAGFGGSSGATACLASGCGPQKSSPKDRVVGAVIGGVLGLFVGSALAGPHVPKTTASPEAMPPLAPETLAHAKNIKYLEVGAILGSAAGFAYGALGNAGGCPTGGGGCGGRDSRLGTTLVGAAAGGGLGILLSLTAPRPKGMVPIDSAAVRIPYQDRGVTVRTGAAVGTLIGMVALPYLISVTHANEAGDGVPVLYFAPLGGLIGMVVGAGMATDH